MHTTKRNFKILLVEDSSLVAKVHTELLESFGCTVTVAEDGLQAVSMGQGDHDLILMDLGLPHLDGVEATARLRQLESNSSTKRKPIIGLTAYDIEEVKAQCLTVGMETVVRKPITAAILEDLIKTHIASCMILSNDPNTTTPK